MLWTRSRDRPRNNRPMCCWMTGPRWHRQSAPQSVRGGRGVRGRGDVRVAARITELVGALLDVLSNRICVEQRRE